MPNETGKAKKNTSKTARVLGLLTTPPAKEEETPAQQAAQKGGAADKPLPPSDDRVVEAQVRSALFQELGSALSEVLPEFTDFEKPEPKPEPEPEPESTPAPKPEPEPESTPAPEPVAGPGPSEVPVPAKPEPPRAEPPIVFSNIMQRLVESKVDKYLDMFGVCKCPHCRADVIALALTNLPSKYVVIEHNRLNPRVNFYESRFDTEIARNLTQACLAVKDRPHHDR